MNRSIAHHIRIATLCLITLALLSLPFAHRTQAAPTTPELASFLAMGGTLADICGDAGEMTPLGCEACRIVGATLLPSRVQAPVTAPLPRAADTVQTAPIHTTSSDAGTPPPARAPPIRMTFHKDTVEN